MCRKSPKSYSPSSESNHQSYPHPHPRAKRSESAAQNEIAVRTKSLHDNGAANLPRHCHTTTGCRLLLDVDCVLEEHLGLEDVARARADAGVDTAAHSLDLV